LRGEKTPRGAKKKARGGLDEPCLPSIPGEDLAENPAASREVTGSNGGSDSAFSQHEHEAAEGVVEEPMDGILQAFGNISPDFVDSVDSADDFDDSDALAEPVVLEDAKSATSDAESVEELVDDSTDDPAAVSEEDSDDSTQDAQSESTATEGDDDFEALEDEQAARARMAKGAPADNTVRWYLQLIGAEGLLRADEEIELGRNIRSLMEWERSRTELAKALGTQPTDEDLAQYLNLDQSEFLPQIQVARRAKDRMIVSNLRLVVSIAKRYMHRGLPLSDIIQEGTLGLIRAAEKFDGERGFKFSTYATWWVKQAVTRCIADQSRTIRLPVHLYDTISAIRKATKTLTATLGRPPSEAEIAEYVGITMEKLNLTRLRMQQTVPLESPLPGTDDNMTLGDIIESPESSPEDLVDNALLRDDLEHVINSLTPRERDVVRMRYGLDDGRTKTLEEIGRVFSVTKERVRQIESKALRKLRHPFRAAVLRDYSPRGSMVTQPYSRYRR
jgi:RNA polymerase primary sigma factor